MWGSVADSFTSFSLSLLPFYRLVCIMPVVSTMQYLVCVHTKFFKEIARSSLEFLFHIFWKKTSCSSPSYILTLCNIHFMFTFCRSDDLPKGHKVHTPKRKHNVQYHSTYKFAERCTNV